MVLRRYSFVSCTKRLLLGALHVASIRTAWRQMPRPPPPVRAHGWGWEARAQETWACALANASCYTLGQIDASIAFATGWHSAAVAKTGAWRSHTCRDLLPERPCKVPVCTASNSAVPTPHMALTSAGCTLAAASLRDCRIGVCGTSHNWHPQGQGDGLAKNPTHRAVGADEYWKSMSRKICVALAHALQ